MTKYIPYTSDNKPADRISLLIAELGVSKNEFARKIGISSALISKITNKGTNFGIETAEKIVSNIPRLNSLWLLTGQGTMWLDDSKSSGEKISHNSGFYHYKPLPPENIVEEQEVLSNKIFSYLEKKYPEVGGALRTIETCSTNLMIIDEIITKNGLGIEYTIQREIALNPKMKDVWSKNPDLFLERFISAFELEKIVKPLNDKLNDFILNCLELEINGKLKIDKEE